MERRVFADFKGSGLVVDYFKDVASQIQKGTSKNWKGTGISQSDLSRFIGKAGKEKKKSEHEALAAIAKVLAVSDMDVGEKAFFIEKLSEAGFECGDLSALSVFDEKQSCDVLARPDAYLWFEKCPIGFSDEVLWHGLEKNKTAAKACAANPKGMFECAAKRGVYPGRNLRKSGILMFDKDALLTFLDVLGRQAPLNKGEDEEGNDRALLCVCEWVGHWLNHEEERFLGNAMPLFTKALDLWQQARPKALSTKKLSSALRLLVEYAHELGSPALEMLAKASPYLWVCPHIDQGWADPGEVSKKLEERLKFERPGQQVGVCVPLGLGLERGESLIACALAFKDDAPGESYPHKNPPWAALVEKAKELGLVSNFHMERSCWLREASMHQRCFEQGMDAGHLFASKERLLLGKDIGSSASKAKARL